MGYKPTYRPLVDITKRFDEFLKYEFLILDGMDILSEQVIDKYFRGEINEEVLTFKCSKAFKYILLFEKYEYKHGEYKYIKEEIKESKLIDKIKNFFE